jgi:type VI secretion system protein ImpJ
MSWDSKVLWSEGLFLQPHHFQQADRRLETIANALARRIPTYAWGISDLEIDYEILKIGQFAIKSCSGLTTDGTLFRIPEADDHPTPLSIPNTVKNCVVYLCIPQKRQGATEVASDDDDASATRLSAAELEIIDTVGANKKTTTVSVGKVRMRFALEVDDLEGQIKIPIAKILEVKADNEIVLDKSFIPSCLDIRAAPQLSAFVKELEGLLSHRVSVLSGRLADNGAAKGAAEISDFLLLIAVNKSLPIFQHLMEIENVHPERLYTLSIALAGELSSFMAVDKKMPVVEPYKHAELNKSFDGVIKVLRQYLSSVLEQTAVPIKLEVRKYGVNVGIIADKNLLDTTNFVLAVSADTSNENIRRHFPAQIKIGPVEEIRQMVNSALPGIALNALPVAPRQVPYNAGSVYFQMDNSDKYWGKLKSSGGIAIHISGDFPGLKMELWAVRLN